MIVYQLLYYFAIYAFLGWILEVAFHGAIVGKVINRGFLNGPFCPIYGVGMIAMIYLLTTVTHTEIQHIHFLIIFNVGSIVCTLIEYFGGWILDQIFHARWWDYRDMPFNINGYVCLIFSLAWGIGCVVAIGFIHPMIIDFVNWIPKQIGWWILGITYFGLTMDMIISVSVMIGLNEKLAQIDKLQKSLRIISDELTERIGGGAMETAQKVSEAGVQARIAGSELKENIVNVKDTAVQFKDNQVAELQQKINSLKETLTSDKFNLTKRLIDAFPSLDSHFYHDTLEDIKRIITSRTKRK